MRAAVRKGSELLASDVSPIAHEHIVRAQRERRADLCLLCDVDVPWVPDGARDRPQNRAAMFDLFRRGLAARDARRVIIRGDWATRWERARDAVAPLGVTPPEAAGRR